METLGPGSILVGRYELQRRLGSGTEGSVWKARDLHGDGIPCAVKVQATALDPALARLLLSLDHPHVARTRDLGALPGGGSFVVMELVEGVALDAVDDVGGVVRAGASVAGALEFLHGAGVVHGDVKPANIVVRGDSAVLVDLGIARSSGDAREGSSGSLAFMSPEALFGAATPARDLYALGVSLVVALGKGHPWVEDPTDARAVLASLVRPAGTIRARVFDRVPAPLRTVLASAVAHDPADRPSSAGAFLRRWRLDSAEWLPATVVDAAWTTDDETIPAAPRWRGGDAAARHVAEQLGRAATGDSAGVVIVGPEGSGRRRLLEDAVRLARTDAAARGEVLARRDATPTSCERPTAFVMVDASAATLRLAADVVERSRRYGEAHPMVLVATSMEAVDDARLVVVERAALSTDALAALLGDLHRAPVAAAVVRRWAEATGGWSGRVVGLSRELGPTAITTAALPMRASTPGAPAPVGLGDDALRLLRRLALARDAVPREALHGDTALATLEARGLVVSERGGVRATAAAGRPEPGDGPAVGALAERLSALGAHGAAARMFAWGGDRARASAATRLALSDPEGSTDEQIGLLREAHAWVEPAWLHATWMAAALCRAGRHAEARAWTEGAGTPAAVLLHGEVLLRAGDREGARRWAEAHRSLAGDVGVAGRVLEHRAALDRGEPPSADELGVTFAEATRPGGDELLAARVLELATLSALGRDERDGAKGFCDAWAQRLGVHAARDPRLAGVRGLLAQRSGDLVGAAAAYRRAWESASRDGDARAAATYLMNLGAASLESGALGEAYRAMRRSASLFAAEGNGASLARALANVASLSIWIGANEESASLIARARRAAEEAGDVLTARWVDALEAEASGDASRSPTYADAVATLGAPVLAAELRARWALGAIDAGSLDEAAAALGVAGADDGAMTSLARFALAVRGHPRFGAPEAAEVRARRGVEADPSVEHELLLLAWSEAAAELTGDRARADSMRARRRHRVDALAATLPDAMADCFRRRHAPSARAEAVERGVSATDDARWRWMLSVVQRIHAEPKLQPLLDRVMDAIIELTGASRGFLLLREADGTLKVRNARNLGARDLVGDEAVVSRSIAERVANTGEALVTVDAATDHRFDATQSVVGLRLRSVLAVPLRVHGEVVGTIYVDDRLRAGAFDERAQSLAGAFADAAAVAIDNARSRSELRRALRRSERLADELERAVAKQRAELETARKAVDPAATRGHYEPLVGRGDAMRRMLSLLDRVAPTPMPVLLQGESGTGKELVARALHDNSPRAARPFVAENCGAIPETLLESTLFGHVRGAFTGADRPRAGLFEAADGGTLFLDEIGEMSPGMQSRLLRVLQEGEVRAVGSERVRKVDVRLIAATHRDLQEMVARGTFREDLYYRLAVIVVRVPALRDRREDIPELVAHFLQRSARREVSVDRAALAALCAAPWPGNVRQLQNEVLRAAVLSEDVIRAEHLTVGVSSPEPRAAPTGHSGLDLRNAVEDVERAMVLRALASHGGNQTRAAKTLGLSRFGLQKKLRRLGISARDVSAEAERKS